jgi:hypothetical protein
MLFSYEWFALRIKKLSMDKESNKVTIKVSGKRTAVLKTLKRIESVFPLFIEGKEKRNDTGDGIHVFLTIACPEQEV